MNFEILNMKRIRSTNSHLSYFVLNTPYIILITLYFILASSCGKKDPNSPGVEFMPDMYRSPSLEVYSTNGILPDSMASQKPVKGTIPMTGYIPYPYANDTAGYTAAGKFLKNPIEWSAQAMAQGEALYIKFCIHCHGPEGKGDGTIVANGKFPGAPPAYTSGALKNLPEGKIFHTLTYGKGLMGSHASQLSQEERWKVVHYVQKLQHAGEVVASADTSATKK